MREVCYERRRFDMLSPKKKKSLKVNLDATFVTAITTTSDTKNIIAHHNDDDDDDNEMKVMQRYLAAQNAMQHHWNMMYLQAFVKLDKQNNVVESQSSATSSAAEESGAVTSRRIVPQEEEASGATVAAEASSDLPMPTYLSMIGTKKNYKNMTRKRRIEANARERSRVHTISAAFEGLRRAVPLYSANQKVSKLAILRIACQYIMALAQLAGFDYSVDQSAPTFDRCIDALVQTIHTEGKVKQK